MAAGGAAALAAEIQRKAMEVAEHEIERLDLGAELAPADMLAVTAWGARLYLLGLGDRAEAARKAREAPPPAGARTLAVTRRRRPASDRAEIVRACAANNHRTEGENGQCACGAYALDVVRRVDARAAGARSRGAR